MIERGVAGNGPQQGLDIGRLASGQWIDENFDILTASVPGNNELPTTVQRPATNIPFSAFSHLNLNEIIVHKELNHNSKLPLRFRFHVHWYPTTADAGDVKWNVEYVADDVGDVLHIDTISSVDTAGGVAWVQHRVEIGAEVVLPEQFDIATQLSIRLFRDPDDAQDTYPALAAVSTFGYHILLDTYGSRGVFEK